MSSRLSSLLVQDGLVSAKRVADAFQRQVIYGGTLDSNLLELKAVDEDDLINYLGRADGMPTQPTGLEGAGVPLPEVLEVFTKEIAERFSAVPTKLLPGGILRVLVPDGVEITEFDELALRVEQRIEPWITLEFRFIEAMDKVYGTGTPSRYARLLARSIQAHQGREWPPARPIDPLPRFGSLSHMRLVIDPPAPPVVTLPTVDEPTALMVAPTVVGETSASLQIAAAMAANEPTATMTVPAVNAADESTASLQVPGGRAAEPTAAMDVPATDESTAKLEIPNQSTAGLAIPATATVAEHSINTQAPAAAQATAAEPTVDMAAPTAGQTIEMAVPAAAEPTASIEVPMAAPTAPAKAPESAAKPSVPAETDRRAVPELLPTQLIDPNSIHSAPHRVAAAASTATPPPSSGVPQPLDDLSVADWMSAADWLSVANKVDPVVSSRSPAPGQRPAVTEPASPAERPVAPALATPPVELKPAATPIAATVVPTAPGADEPTAVSIAIPVETPVEKSAQLAVPATTPPVVESKPAAPPTKPTAPPPQAEAGGRKKGKKGKDKQGQSRQQPVAPPVATKPVPVASPANQAKPGPVPAVSTQPGKPATAAALPVAVAPTAVATPPVAAAQPVVATPAVAATAAAVVPAKPVEVQAAVSQPAVATSQPDASKPAAQAADSQAKPAQPTSSDVQTAPSAVKPSATPAAASGPVAAAQPSTTSTTASGPVGKPSATPAAASGPVAKPTATSAAASGPFPTVKPSATPAAASGPVVVKPSASGPVPAVKPSATPAAASGPVPAAKPSAASAPASAAGAKPGATSATPSGAFPVVKPSAASVPASAAGAKSGATSATPSGAFPVVKPSAASVPASATGAKSGATSATPSGAFPVVKPSATPAAASGPVPATKPSASPTPASGTATVKPSVAPVSSPAVAAAKPATPAVTAAKTTELAEPPPSAPPREPRSSDPAPKPEVAVSRAAAPQPATAPAKPERDSRAPDPIPEPVNSGRLGEIIIVVKEPSKPPLAAAAPPAPRSGESPLPRLGPPPRVATALDAGGSSAISLEAARELAGTVEDRDAIFEALCRGARSRVAFAAVLTLHGEVAFGRVALQDDWMDRAQLGRIAVPVDRASPFRTVAKERTTFLGTLGSEATSSDPLRALGRSVPIPAAVLPVLVRGRAVALLYLDDDGRELLSEVLDELKPLLADVGQAFVRIAQKSKSGGLGAEAELGIVGDEMPAVGTSAFRSPSTKSPRPAGQAVADSQITPLPPNVPAAAVSPVPTLAAEQPTVPLRIAPPAAQAGKPATEAPRSPTATPTSTGVPEPLHSQPTVPIAVTTKISASPAAGSPKPGAGKNDKRGGKPAEVAAPVAAAAAAPAAARDASVPPALAELIQRASNLDETAIDQLLAGGAEAARALVAALPGPLRSRDRQTLGDPAGNPVYSRGPLLALALRMGHSVVEPLLARLADPATTAETRYYLTLCFAEIPVTAAVAPLAQGLYDNDDGVRMAAVTALRNFPPSSELSGVVSKLRDTVDAADVKRARYAVEALGELRVVAAVPQLINLLDHEDPALVDALGRALQTITKQDFSRSRVRWTAWWRRRQDEPRLQWLLEGLTHPSAMLRSAAQDELTSLSGDVVGYRFDQPRRDRELARKRWAQWWQRRGYPVL